MSRKIIFIKQELLLLVYLFFFFNDTATTEIYTLSLHDALPISSLNFQMPASNFKLSSVFGVPDFFPTLPSKLDRKSTRLNSSHVRIPYAVFCLKKKEVNTFGYF